MVAIVLKYKKCLLIIIINYYAYYETSGTIEIVIKNSYQVRNMPRGKNYLQKNYRRCQKNIGILFNICEYEFQITLALADICQIQRWKMKITRYPDKCMKQYVRVVNLGLNIFLTFFYFYLSFTFTCTFTSYRQ